MQDRARIFVQAGAGGNGAVSFRREAHVPRGGPDGGDGGRGADVVLVADPSLRDLQHFRRRGHWKAPRGGRGEGANRSGESPDALLVRVPPGTIVEDAGRGARWDLAAAGQRALVARGGLGGRGNKRFATSTRQAPRFAERGLAGEVGWLDLRLKLLADVGLVGLPNAGKSSLLARLTRAAPKVADYPFTTLEPVLGMLERDERQVVVADIPGLIEGAGEGAGLGHEFLAHVERTRLLVHVLDLAPLDGSDPAANLATVEAELAAHGEGLARLPRILALSKADLVPPEEADGAAAEWRARLGGGGGDGPTAAADPTDAAGRTDAARPAWLDVVVTSSATRHGVDELGDAIVRHLPDEQPHAAPETPLAEHRVYRPADDGWRVDSAGEGAWRVSGPAVERLIERHDIENEEALRYIEERLRTMGVVRALESAGFERGQDVEIAGVIFEFDPGAPFRS